MTPTNHDVSVNDEANHNIPYIKDQMKADTDNGEAPDESEDITWQMLSVIQDRLCLYVYIITIVILVVVFLLALFGIV